MAQVTIYTTPTCTFCKMAKAYFTDNKVTYDEKDVTVDAEARDAMINKSGQMGVPVIEVDGQIVVGFDQPRLKELLNLS